MSRRRQIVLGVLAAVTCAVVLFGLTMYASLSGGWDDAFRPKKRASDSDVREARKKAEPEQAKRAEALVASVRAVLGPAVRSAEQDPSRSECEEGQHNWKIDDEYDVRCELVTTAAVRLRAGEEERRGALHARLLADGWTLDGGVRGDPGFLLYEAPGYRLQIQSADGTLELTLRHTYYEG